MMELLAAIFGAAFLFEGWAVWSMGQMLRASHKREAAWEENYNRLQAAFDSLHISFESLGNSFDETLAIAKRLAA